MAKGREKVEARKHALSLLGKDLARRAQRRCEFCEARDDLRPHDTSPTDEPSLDALVLLCQRCRRLVAGEPVDARQCRFLEGAVWSEVPVVADLAKQCLGRIDADWARDTLDMVM